MKKLFLFFLGIITPYLFMRNQYEQAHQYLHNTEYRKIPIIIHIPNQEEDFYNQDIEKNVLTLADLFPTMLHLIGSEIPKGY